MIWLTHAQQAVINLKAAKLRAFLAVLGVLIGTAAVVALLSAGKLATEKALAEFKALGTDLLAVTVFAKEQKQQNTNEGLPLSAWRSMPSGQPSIRLAAPYAVGFQTISFAGQPLQGSVIGADESLAKILHIRMQSGHFVSFVHSFEQYCVIGHKLAEEIKRMTLVSPIGKQIQIGNLLYTIIGIAKPWEESAFFNQNINQAVIIPILGMPLVNQNSQINNAIFLLKPDAPLEPIIQYIKQTIQKQLPNNMVFIRSAQQIIKSMENQGQVFTLLLAVIGAISLLVGGIGVMNVMLVSVTERKREIGIRKAVGAKTKDIQMLFLIEAILLSIAGGGLGILAGLLLTKILSLFTGWPFSIYLMPPLIGCTVSVFTGIFFGFYPAKKASQLDPIVCLRQE